MWGYNIPLLLTRNILKDLIRPHNPSADKTGGI
eukprot:COSAG02_NODE_34892_length_477_cov_0.330688_1_plen_32_part_10